MIRHLSDKELKELEVLKTVNAGANIKNIVNNTKLQQPKKIDLAKIIASQKGQASK